MSYLNLKKLSDQFEELSTLMMAISGTFRDAGYGGDDTVDDDAPAKPVRGAAKSAPAGKPAAKKAAKKVTDEDSLDIDTVRAKLTELMDAKGKDKMIEALEHVGAGKLGDVDESQYQDLFDKAEELLAEEEEEAPAPKKTAAKKTSKKTGPTLDDVTAAAEALIEADKTAYVKIMKKLGKPSEMDEADYAKAIAAYEAAMPEADAEESDEGLL